MDGSWVCYDDFGVWCNFRTLDSSPRPPIFGEMGKLHQILPKICLCPHLTPCHNQTAQYVQTGKYSF